MGPDDSFLDDDDPEIREVLQQIDREKREGRIKAPPRRPVDVKNLEDLCRYVFKLAHLDGDYQMRIEAGVVKRWVWFGHDFRDKMVRVVEEIAPRLSDTNGLEELRLVATRITDIGVERLRRIFPRTRVTRYSDEDDRDNWQWSQASYMGEQSGKRTRDQDEQH